MKFLTNQPVYYLGLAYLLVLLIIVLSLLPGKNMPHLNWWDWLAVDKIGHFGLYALTCWCFKQYAIYRPTLHRLPAIYISLILMGFLLECIQYFMHQGRQFDPLDVLANSLGVALIAFYWKPGSV